MTSNQLQGFQTDLIKLLDKYAENMLISEIYVRALDKDTKQDVLINYYQEANVDVLSVEHMKSVGKKVVQL